MSEIGNKMRILVTFANTYDMPAEAGRDAMRGCIVHYFFLGEDGDAFRPLHSSDSTAPLGYQRSKVSMDYAMRGKIKAAPGIYDGYFAMTVGSDGKPVLKLIDLDYVESFDIRRLIKMDQEADARKAAEKAESGKAAK